MAGPALPIYGSKDVAETAAVVHDNVMAFRHEQVKVPSGEFHVVSGGTPGASTLLFLHGWPQDWSAFDSLMTLAAESARVVAIDLPGVGRSHFCNPPSRKHALAAEIRGLVQKLGLEGITVVGHDVGGQIAYSYLRQFSSEITAVVIMDVVIPGIDPWDEVLHNPHIWHFAFHNVPHLPERLVIGKQAEYFDFFFNAIAASSSGVTNKARHRYVEAYREASALKAGFDWYRAFRHDAEDNVSYKGRALQTPVLLIRGDRESGKISKYVDGLRKSGVTNVSGVLIPDAGHFSAEEQPEAAWRAIASFIAS